MTDSDRLFTFVAGSRGGWTMLANSAVVGDPLPTAPCLTIVQGQALKAAEALWTLSGVVSNERYVTQAEKARLVSAQPALGRPEATHAAFIPIRKTKEWWGLAQDRRREIFEERSSHIAIGHQYLPAIARRLHHCRDLGGPFDFLTWFEFRPEDAAQLDELLARLRKTEEWKYVDREIDIRLSRRAE
jgi:chlorite dismutase